MLFCGIVMQVIAFAMKEYGWSLDETLKYVRTKRAVVRPNKGFMRQLTTYEGILAARYNTVYTLYALLAVNVYIFKIPFPLQ